MERGWLSPLMLQKILHFDFQFILEPRRREFILTVVSLSGFIFIFIIVWYQGLNSQRHTCQAGAYASELNPRLWFYFLK